MDSILTDLDEAQQAGTARVEYHVKSVNQFAHPWTLTDTDEFMEDIYA